MNKSEQIDRKYVEVIDIDDYEILTDTGWEDIVSVNKTIQYDIWYLKTDNHELKCADNHIVFDQSLNEIFVKDLKIGDKIITESGIETVQKIVQTNENDNMYDLSLPENSNKRFYSNGILSHNSTIYCIYALWYTTFFPEKKVMILANKAATAIDLLGRVSMAYTYLPKFIKCSCTEFNKSSITFGNMSWIKAFASSSDAARGFSSNCTSGDTKIKIRLFKKDWLTFNLKIKYLKFFKFLNTCC